MVYTAEFEFGDIEGRNVLDLGCGTGMLGIAAGILGAATVTGLDVDSGALRTAAENADDMGVDMDLVCCDVARNPCVPGKSQPVVLLSLTLTQRIVGGSRGLVEPKIRYDHGFPLSSIDTERRLHVDVDCENTKHKTHGRSDGRAYVSMNDMRSLSLVAQQSASMWCS